MVSSWRRLYRVRSAGGSAQLQDLRNGAIPYRAARQRRPAASSPGTVQPEKGAFRMFDAAKIRVPWIVPGLLVACLLAPVTAGAATPVRKTAPEPAATLLLPYFEQDLANPNGSTTLFSINNA